MPTRILDIPPQEETWAALDNMLQGWEELSCLMNSSTLSAWEVAGLMRACSPKTPLLPSYSRSLIQSNFFERNQVMNQYPTVWLVDRYFVESTGHRYDTIQRIIQENWTASRPFSVKEFERHAIKTIVQRIRADYQNPPRRRRTLMKSIPEWHTYYLNLRRFTSDVSVEDAKTRVITNALPFVPRLSQYFVALDIVLSGFQQELYSTDERAVAYWTAAELIELQLDSMNTLRPVIDPSSPAMVEWEFQHTYLGALQVLMKHMCVITSTKLTLPAERSVLNYTRRYKWLFSTTFPDNIQERIIPLPEFDHFTVALASYKLGDIQSKKTALVTAKESFLRLSEYDGDGFWAPKQNHRRLEFVRSLADVCDGLYIVIEATYQSSEVDLRWDPTVHPWFPQLVRRT